MLFEQVLSSGNLRDAWKRVKQNKGASGVDGLTIDDYPMWIHQHWEAIHRGLQQGYYCPLPVKRGNQWGQGINGINGVRKNQWGQINGVRLD